MHLPFHTLLVTLLLPLLAFSSTLKPAKNKDLPSDFKYLGCYMDDANHRLLPQTNGTGYLADGDDMTGTKCINFCHREGYTIAGLEYGIECFCGRNFTTVPPPKSDKDACSSACSGNAEEACGGDYKLTVYFNKEAEVQGVATRAGAGMIGLVALVIGGALLV